MRWSRSRGPLIHFDTFGVLASLVVLASYNVKCWIERCSAHNSDPLSWSMVNFITFIVSVVCLGTLAAALLLDFSI